MYYRSQIIQILSILLFFCTTCDAQLLIKLTNSSYSYNSKIFSNVNFTTSHDSLYIDLMLLQPIHAGFKANLEFYVRAKNFKDYRKLFSYNFDVCIMTASVKDTLFKKWFQSLLKVSNFLTNCPVAKGYYYLNGWKMDESLVPSYLIPGYYRVKANFFYSGNKAKMLKDYLINIQVESLVEAINKKKT